MTYTDYPDSSHQGRLINNLNLLIESSDGEIYHRGNIFKSNRGNGDRHNNVEGLAIDSPRPGGWIIKVIAVRVKKGCPQDFALVVSGGGLKLL